MKRIYAALVFLAGVLLCLRSAGSTLAPPPTGPTFSSQEWAAQAPPIGGTHAYRMRLTQMVKEKRVDVLQAHFEARIALYARGELTDSTIDRMFEMTGATELAQAGVFDAWVDAYPQSFIGPLARAYFDMHRAWTARGTKLARETQTNEFAEMDRWLPLVRRDVLLALHREPRCALCYAMLIRLSMPLGLRKEALAWFSQGLAVDANSLEIPYAYFYSLDPRWGGSLDQQDALISKLRLTGKTRAATNLQAGALAEQARRCCNTEPFDGTRRLMLAQASLQVADSYSARVSKGIALVNLKRWQESIDVLTDAIHAYGADAYVYENRALAYA